MARYREIEAELTAPGQRFEVITCELAGRPAFTYRNTAPSLGAIIEELTERHSDSLLAIDDRGGSRSYAEVAADAARLATALDQRYGVRRDDRVGVLMANSPSFLVALFAITRLGATAVLYNSRSNTAELGAALSEVPVKAMIVDGRRAETLAALSVQVPTIVAGEQTGGQRRATAMDELILDHPGWAPLADIEAGDTCLILFTSGTSGRAKGVMLSHRNVLNVAMNMHFVTEVNLRIAARTYGIALEDVRAMMPKISALLIFPLFHVSGLAALLSAMNSGGAVATMARWNPQNAAQLIADHDLTLMAGPPMTVDDLLRVPDAANLLRSLTSVVPGGQATPPNVSQQIAQTVPGARRSSGWGMTEVGGSVCTAGGDLLAAFPSTVGPMSPTMQVRAVDSNGEVITDGRPGELELRGGLVMTGYAGRPEETARSFHDGWLRTGDIGYVDDRGLVYIVDRLKDLVISSGENIACNEVELALAESNLFTEVAAFGVPDQRRGERLVVAVTLRPEHAHLTAAELHDLASTALPKYKCPSDILIDYGPFPRNATGKVLKREIRTRYLGS